MCKNKKTHCHSNKSFSDNEKNKSHKRHEHSNNEHHEHSSHEHSNHEHHKQHEHSNNEHHEHSSHEHHKHNNHKQHEHSNHEQHKHNNHKHHQHSSHEHHEHSNHEHHDHTEHHIMMIKDFKTKFFISLLFTIPVILISALFAKIIGSNILRFEGSEYLELVISSFIFFYGGIPFFKGAFEEIKSKKPGMMTLIAIAITVAYTYSVYTVIAQKSNNFFWELVTLIDIMLLGHWIEMHSVVSASNSLKKLANLIPDKANLIIENEIKEIETSKLKIGDIILVKPGDKIPSDGIIINGNSKINESMLTGESKLISKTIGDKVIGGSINTNGSIEIEVTATNENNYLSKVIKLVQEAKQSKSKTQHLADKAAFALTILSISVGIITFIVWLAINKDLDISIKNAATVMIITCPHALGLAIPLVVSRSTDQLAKNGILVRNRVAFEKSRKVNVVVFDKTGTLTYGNFDIENIKIFDSKYNQNKIIQIAHSLEKHSNHPIANAISNYAQKLNISSYKLLSNNIIPGYGLNGSLDIDGEVKNVKLVNFQYLTTNNLNINSIENSIATNVFLLIENELIAHFSLNDKIREESYDTIAKLKEKNIKTYMLTGDNELVAQNVANKLGLDGYFANVLPDQKESKIRELQKNNNIVMMVGDGINDAPALARADVGVSISSGTDIAQETSNIILINNNLKDVLKLTSFAKKTYNKMIQNLVWATLYNLIAIPLAAGVLSSINITISPEVGAIFMTLSTVIVAINAMLLRIKKH
ncbi:copper-translocating P-type ATPase [Mycoplasma sp. CSL7503-lung]|uniref:copper-translocating P-type ATPase n=1 Tax=Mycoplasma sp. CSL7503-lung TaxID=536372 RepID=UPI0021D316A8|nr:copper-translocating P-type ATPase [Mycoplasma sp. CSL7503-lung]MCU4706921.1 copper-translocating P-type ATPase [Mycoplasma sp. CSL7503-lung]